MEIGKNSLDAVTLKEKHAANTNSYQRGEVGRRWKIMLMFFLICVGLLLVNFFLLSPSSPLALSRLDEH